MTHSERITPGFNSGRNVVHLHFFAHVALDNLTVILLYMQHRVEARVFCIISDVLKAHNSQSKNYNQN